MSIMKENHQFPRRPDITIIASGSSGNCYRISDGTTALLIECGLPLKKIKEGCGFKLSGISGCLLSHCHGDHSKSALSLAKAGVDVYCSMDTLLQMDIEGESYRLHTIPALQEFIIGTFKIVPFPVHHDVTNFGYYITSGETGERLMFATDTYYVTYVFPSLTHVMIEANYSEKALAEAVNDGRTPEELKRRLYHSHMSIETTVKLLEANNQHHTIRQVYLLHLSANNSDAPAFKKAVQESTGAEVYIA